MSQNQFHGFHQRGVTSQNAFSQVSPPGLAQPQGDSLVGFKDLSQEQVALISSKFEHLVKLPTEEARLSACVRACLSVLKHL